jgi:hypothetical protein
LREVNLLHTNKFWCPVMKRFKFIWVNILLAIFISWKNVTRVIDSHFTSCGQASILLTLSDFSLSILLLKPRIISVLDWMWSIEAFYKWHHQIRGTSHLVWLVFYYSHNYLFSFLLLVDSSLFPFQKTIPYFKIRKSFCCFYWTFVAFPCVKKLKKISHWFSYLWATFSQSTNIYFPVTFFSQYAINEFVLFCFYKLSCSFISFIFPYADWWLGHKFICGVICHCGFWWVLFYYMIFFSSFKL